MKELSMTLLHGDEVYCVRGENILKLLRRYQTTGEVLDALGLTLDTITLPAAFADKVISLWWYMEGSSAIRFNRSYFGRNSMITAEKKENGLIRMIENDMWTSTIQKLHGIARRMADHHPDDYMVFTFYY